MEKYASASAMFTVQDLREKLNRLSERYEHVSSDLKNKNEPKNVQSIRRLEREFLMHDINRRVTFLITANEKMIKEAEKPSERYHRLFVNIRRRLA